MSEAGGSQCYDPLATSDAKEAAQEITKEYIDALNQRKHAYDEKTTSLINDLPPDFTGQTLFNAITNKETSYPPGMKRILELVDTRFISKDVLQNLFEKVFGKTLEERAQERAPVQSVKYDVLHFSLHGGFDAKTTMEKTLDLKEKEEKRF